MVMDAWYGRAAAVVGVLAALVPALFMWGFTVDDALISLRYAHHLATGAGYRFNALGPATDGVTPLPWPLLVAPFSAGDLMTALLRVKGFPAPSLRGEPLFLAPPPVRSAARGLAVLATGRLGKLGTLRPRFPVLATLPAVPVVTNVLEVPAPMTLNNLDTSPAVCR